MSDIKSKVIEEIKKIFDPEIPVNIYDLGLIYKIEVDEKRNVKIAFETEGSIQKSKFLMMQKPEEYETLFKIFSPMSPWYLLLPVSFSAQFFKKPIFSASVLFFCSVAIV